MKTREEQIRNKAKELGQKYFPDETNIWARGNIEAEYVEYACLEMAKWLDQHPNWISVEDDLPEVDEQTTLSNECVVVDSAGARYFGFYNGTDECWYTDDYTMILFVTHWMEIVSPRKEGKE